MLVSKVNIAVFISDYEINITTHLFALIKDKDR